MNQRQTEALRKLHVSAVEGEQARAKRDRLLLTLASAQGVSQTKLAEMLDKWVPGSMTRNQMQKVIMRQRAKVVEE